MSIPGYGYDCAWKDRKVNVNGKDNGPVAGMLNADSRPGLTRTLIMWFLIMALAPLAVISVINYMQARDSLQKSIVEAQQTAIALKTAFINNWFSYRFLDLESQSTNLENTRFLGELRKAFQAGGNDVGNFVRSYRWASIVDEHGTDLKTFRRTYGYYASCPTTPSFISTPKGNRREVIDNCP